MIRNELTSRETAILHEVMVAEVGLFEYLRIVWKYLWVIVLISMAAMAAAGILSMSKPPRYVAVTTIVPPADSSGGLGLGAGFLGGAESALLRNMMNASSVADLYVGILNSQVVADAIVDRFDLVHVYDVNGVRYKAERELRKNTRVNLSDDRIVSIAVEDGDPSRAATIANAYVEELDRQNRRLSGGQATSKRLFLENRLREIEAKLRRIDTLPSHEAQVQERLYEVLIRECELAKIEEAKSMPTIQVLDTARPPEVRQARGTVRRVALAGVIATAFGVLLAFGCEYAVHARRRRGRISRVVERAASPEDDASPLRERRAEDVAKMAEPGMTTD